MWNIKEQQGYACNIMGQEGFNRINPECLQQASHPVSLMKINKDQYLKVQQIFLTKKFLTNFYSKGILKIKVNMVHLVDARSGNLALI